jgi:2-dehydropantoate 2-reductase
MRIAVMGTGGIGGYFGGYLAQENDVTFIARDDHLAAIRKNGLRVVSTETDLHIDPAVATDDPGTLEPFDIVLFCVKLYDTLSAAEIIAPIVGPNTRVLTLQNGVDGAEQLAEKFGREHVLGGVAYIAAKIDAPGVVSYLPGMTRMVLGTMHGQADPVVNDFLNACQTCPFGAEIADDIQAALWTKMILLATNAGISATSRLPIRVTFDDDETRGVAVAAFREAEAVARALGVDLPDDIVDRLTQASKGFPKDMYASMYYDLVAGKRIEIDGLPGTIVRLGAEHGIPTPVHSTFYAMLKPYRDGAPALSH